MPAQKQQQPSIRRISYIANPTRANDYAEQKANAEQRAGRKVTKVKTRRVRHLLLDDGSPGPHRFRTNEWLLHRTFIFG